MLIVMMMMMSMIMIRFWADLMSHVVQCCAAGSTYSTLEVPLPFRFCFCYVPVLTVFKHVIWRRHCLNTSQNPLWVIIYDIIKLSENLKGVLLTQESWGRHAVWPKIAFGYFRRSGPGKEWVARSLNVSSIIQLSRALFNMNYTAIQSGWHELYGDVLRLTRFLRAGCQTGSPYRETCTVNIHAHILHLPHWFCQELSTHYQETCTVCTNTYIFIFLIDFLNHDIYHLTDLKTVSKWQQLDSLLEPFHFSTLSWSLHSLLCQTFKKTFGEIRGEMHFGEIQFSNLSWSLHSLHSLLRQTFEEKKSLLRNAFLNHIFALQPVLRQTFEKYTF